MEAVPTRVSPADPLALFSSFTRAGLLAEASELLSSLGIPEARREALWIMEETFGLSSVEICVHGEEEVPFEARVMFGWFCHRRARREPLQYILGSQEFCGLDFAVGPGVLIPRTETQQVVDEVVSHVQRLSRSPWIADIGTGSGCMAVALARALPTATVFAIDLSETALGFARENAARHQVDTRIVFCQGDALEPLRAKGLTGKLAAVTSNPPYIATSELADLPPEVRDFEPSTALDGGPDGLSLHRQLIQEAWDYLTPGGSLTMELGQGQGHEITRTVDAIGGIRVTCLKQDGAGIDRVVCVQRNE